MSTSASCVFSISTEFEASFLFLVRTYIQMMMMTTYTQKLCTKAVLDPKTKIR